MPATPLRHLASNTLRRVLSREMLSLAAAIAFTSALSMAPLLLLVVGAAGALGGEQAVREEILRQIHALVGAQGESVARGIMQRATRPGGGLAAVTIGLVLTVFGATTFFAQLQYALNQVWGVEVRPGFGMRRLLWTRLTSLGLILATGFLLALSLLTSSAAAFVAGRVRLEALESSLLLRTGDVLGSLILYTLTFGILFRTLPDVWIDWRDVAVGSLLTAILFTAGKEGIDAYLTWTGVGSAYGAAGSLFLLLLWAYYASMLVLAGAAFTRAFARGRGRDIAPKDYARRLPALTDIGSGA